MKWTVLSAVLISLIDLPGRTAVQVKLSPEEQLAQAERIRQSISRGQYRINVKYDEEFGYPRSVDLDPRREVSDDELYFVVRNFQPIPAGLH
jgi:hypothetical protein